jgi:hypothetical protein
VEDTPQVTKTNNLKEVFINYEKRVRGGTKAECFVPSQRYLIADGPQANKKLDKSPCSKGLVIRQFDIFDTKKLSDNFDTENCTIFGYEKGPIFT